MWRRFRRTVDRTRPEDSSVSVGGDLSRRPGRSPLGQHSVASADRAGQPAVSKGD